MANDALEFQQARLPLERGYDRRATPISSRYRQTKNGLKEDFGDGYILYGDWDRLFGCWMVKSKGSGTRQQEILPDWPFLAGSDGFAAASRLSVLRHRDILPERELFPGRRATVWFANYLYGIPTIMQDLAAPYGKMQWLVLDLCHQMPGFWRFLHTEREHGRAGYPAAAFAVFSTKGQCDRKARREFACNLAHSNRETLLSDLLECDVSRPAVRIFEKLPANVSAFDIERLLDALSQPDKAHALRHMAAISADIIEAAVSLPAGFFHPEISQLMEQGVTVSQLDRIVTQAVNCLTDQQRLAASRSFSRIKTIAALKDWHEKWRTIGRLNQPFPEPPHPAKPPLIPITNFEALKAEGRRMQNCVATFWSEVLTGQMYFYHWDGLEPASVSIVSTPSGRWMLQEALGFDNEALTPETLDEIGRHFS